MQIIRLVNFSSKLSDEVVSKIAEAINAQVTEDLIPAWGLGEYTVVAGTQSKLDWAISLVDELDDNALGWHADNKSPYGQINVTEIMDFGGAPLNGLAPDHPSVSSVCSHEVVEMILDPLADAWVARSDGSSIAKEGCDPCQGFSYQKNTIDVSDFVLPAWFDAIAGGPWDFLNACPGPMQLAPSGYMITKAADGSTSQVYGDVIPGLVWQTRRGRKRRRGLK